MISHDEMLDNVAVYALGILPPGEAAAVAAHLQTCEQCQQEYKLLRPAVTAVGYSAQTDASDAPGPLLKARIMREIRSEPPARSAARWPVGLSALAAACFALAVGAGLLDFSLRDRINRDTAKLAQQSATIAQQSAAMAQQSATIADLASSKRYAFGNGAVLVHGSRLYIAMNSLAQPPAGKVYQAWTLPKGSKRMAPSVTFKPQANGGALVSLPVSAQDVAAVAVSVEPAGGSKQPTTKPIAVAAL
jgi:anti-sigma-K factor RskA